MPDSQADPLQPSPLLSLRGISKAFSGVPALKDSFLDVYPGEVHAVMGENGAGKSTLMKILSGVYQPDAGEILLDQQPIRFNHPRQAQEQGISIIHQEFTLLPFRTVAQNIFLGREPRRGWWVDTPAMNRATQELLAYLGADKAISPRRVVGGLSVAQQQTVEIAKALSFKSRIVVMDEPTASLSPAEVQALFERVRALQASGIAFIYISHRLEEIRQIAQRITVLKDGEVVGTGMAEEFSTSRIISMMVGRELTSYYPPYGEPDRVGNVVLSVRGGGNADVRDIDLDVRAGEVVGLAGLAGSGRTELARAIFGIEPFTSGQMQLDGKPVHMAGPRAAIAGGMGFLTEDRKTEGLVLGHSIADNALLARRSVPGDRQAGGALETVARNASRVDLRARDLYQEVQYLSGGNQQKVVLMKWLARGSRFFIFDEPTRGIDVGAKAGIHELIRELANAGAAVLMISSDLPEVIGMSDRILVMSEGTIAGELTAGSSEAQIMELATNTREVLA